MALNVNKIIEQSLSEAGMVPELDTAIPNYISHAKAADSVKSTDPTTVEGWKEKIKADNANKTSDPTLDDYKKMVQSTKQTKELAQKHADFEKKHPGEIERREKEIEAQNLDRIEKEGKELEDAKKLDTDSFQGKDAADARAKDLLAQQAQDASDAEHAERATIGHHAKEYANELHDKGKKFFREMQTGERRLSNAPEHIRRYLKSLDPENTALATGGAIAAGLGALALRNRLRKKI